MKGENVFVVRWMSREKVDAFFNLLKETNSVRTAAAKADIPRSTARHLVKAYKEGRTITFARPEGAEERTHLGDRPLMDNGKHPETKPYLPFQEEQPSSVDFEIIK